MEYVVFDVYNKIMSLDIVMLESYLMVVIEIDGKSYFVLNIYLEIFYFVLLKYLLWIYVYYDEIVKLKFKRFFVYEF